MSILASVPQSTQKRTRKNGKKNQPIPTSSPFSTLSLSYGMLQHVHPFSARLYVVFSWFIGEELLVNDCSALTRERYPVVLLLSELLGESPVPSIPQGGLDRCLGFSLYVIFVNGK